MKPKEMMDRLREETGITVHKNSLLQYDRINLIRAQRESNGWRFYTEKDYQKFKLVSILSKCRIGHYEADQIMNKKKRDMIKRVKAELQSRKHLLVEGQKTIEWFEGGRC